MRVGQPKLSETFRKKNFKADSGLLISEVMGEAPHSAFGSWVT